MEYLILQSVKVTVEEMDMSLVYTSEATDEQRGMEFWDVWTNNETEQVVRREVRTTEDATLEQSNADVDKMDMKIVY